MDKVTLHSLTLGGKIVSMSRPWVMTIINITPDSFYAGSRTGSMPDIERRVQETLAYTDVYDLGGYSSRPGAADVSAEEEYERLARGLEAVRRLAPELPVSVDTFRSEVARRVVENFGVEIINDISGGDLDANMWQTVADLGVVYVLMHMRGTPASMQSHTDYADVTAEVLEDLARKTACLHEMGVADIIIDPGFGFAKTLQQNYRLLADMKVFTKLGHPVLAGVSRKSMIYKALDITPAESLNGTTVINTLALERGADILRVHDARQAREAIELVSLMQNAPIH